MRKIKKRIIKQETNQKMENAFISISNFFHIQKIQKEEDELNEKHDDNEENLIYFFVRNQLSWYRMSYMHNCYYTDEKMSSKKYKIDEREK